MKLKKNSDPRIKANNKHDKKTYSRLTFRMRHSEMKCFKSFCDEKKYSYNNFLVTAIKDRIEKETGKSFDDLLQEPEELENPKEPKNPEDEEYTEEPEDQKELLTSGQDTKAPKKEPMNRKYSRFYILV